MLRLTPPAALHLNFIFNISRSQSIADFLLIRLSIQLRLRTAFAAAAIDATRDFIRHELFASRRTRVPCLTSIETQIQIIASTHVFGDARLDECFAFGQQCLVEIRVFYQERLFHRLGHLCRTFGSGLFLVGEFETATHQFFLGRGEFGRRTAAYASCEEEYEQFLK